jgi:hypothetical protein
MLFFVFRGDAVGQLEPSEDRCFNSTMDFVVLASTRQDAFICQKMVLKSTCKGRVRVRVRVWNVVRGIHVNTFTE